MFKHGTVGFELSNQYFEIISILSINLQNKEIGEQIEASVNNNLYANKNASANHLVAQIHKLVYKLYGLRENEIKINRRNT